MPCSFFFGASWALCGLSLSGAVANVISYLYLMSLYSFESPGGFSVHTSVGPLGSQHILLGIRTIYYSIYLFDSAASPMTREAVSTTMAWILNRTPRLRGAERKPAPETGRWTQRGWS